MGIKFHKPTSPGRRGMSGFVFEEITTSTPEKSLLVPLNKKGGRNNNGRITVRHRGGGHKRRYRIIDFSRNKTEVPAKVVSVEYDPNRSARISLLHYVDGEKRYILTPSGSKVGDVVLSGENVDIKPGNALPLKNIPVGTLLHCIELRPGKGAQLGRSAGAVIQLMAKSENYAQLKLRSGEIRKVRIETQIRDDEKKDFGFKGKKKFFKKKNVKPTGFTNNPNYFGKKNIDSQSSEEETKRAKFKIKSKFKRRSNRPKNFSFKKHNKKRR